MPKPRLQLALTLGSVVFITSLSYIFINFSLFIEEASSGRRGGGGREGGAVEGAGGAGGGVGCLSPGLIQSGASGPRSPRPTVPPPAV